MNNQQKQHNQKPQQQRHGLLDTNVPLDPVTVGYTIETRDIQEFTERYLRDNGIDRVEAVRIRVDRSGDRPKVTVFAFIGLNSKDLHRQQMNVAEHLRNKIDMGGQKPSDKLKKVIKTLAGNNTNIRQDNRLKVAHFTVDIFRVLGLMLAADPRVHQLNIPFVDGRKRGSTITVFKSLKFVDRGPSDFDKYSKIVDSSR